MGRLLIAIYRRLDLLQRQLWFKIAASVLALALCGSYFGVMMVRSSSIHSQAFALYDALANQNLTRNDSLAVSLRDHGEVFVNGRMYGGANIKNSRIAWFDENGDIANLPYLVQTLVADQVPPWAPRWLFESRSTVRFVGLVAIGWCLLVIWMHLTVAAMVTAIGTAVPVTLCYVLDAPQAMLAFLGIGGLTFTFLMLNGATQTLLSWPWQVFAVAHTLIKEAARIRASQFFIVVLLIVLPILPQLLDPASPLRFRLQSFISLSVGLTFFIAACMTLCLSCASVAFEIRDRQIWQLMTKPVGRLNYLLGKWLGVMLVNLNLLLVSGVATFGFVQFMSKLPVASGPAGEMDALAVRDEVLTARVARRPEYQTLDPEQISRRVDQVMSTDPNFTGREVSLAERRRKAIEIQQHFSSGQRTVAPGDQGAQMYVFKNLSAVRSLNATMSLRYRFHIMRDDEHQTFPAMIVFLDKEENVLASQPSTFVPTMSHTLPIPTGLVQDDGTLRVGIVNLYQPPPEHRGYGALNFEEKDFELMFKVGSFESNFFRAILMNWLKLAFLSALGICCATFLSFPVACLASFTVFIAGSIGPFLAESLKYYGSYDFNRMDWTNIGMVLGWAFESFTAVVASALVFLLGSFGEYRPTQNLVEGLLIPWGAVFSGFARLALLWSGLSMVVGWIVMRRRQLAIYSGHG